MTGTNTFSNSDLQYTIPEIWLPMLQEAFFARTVAARFFKDLTSMVMAQGGGDIFHIPDIFTNVFTSSSKSTASEVTLVSPAQGEVQLTVNTWNHVAYLIEDRELQHAMRAYSIMEEYAKQAGNVLRDDLEDSIFGLWSGLSQTFGSTGAAVTDLQIRQCVNALDVANIPKADRAFFFYPSVFWLQVAALTKFYTAGTFGFGGSNPVYGPSQSGMLGGASKQDDGFKGIIYGDQVYTSSNVVSNASAYRNIYAHKDAFAFATLTPGGNRVRMQMDYKLENLGMLAVADILYGVVELRDAAACVLNGSTSATAA